MVEDLPIMCETLGSILSTTKKEVKERLEGGRESGGRRREKKTHAKEDYKKTSMFYLCPLY